jgi:outer membrane translocation and assembly module TamA
MQRACTHDGWEKSGKEETRLPEERGYADCTTARGREKINPADCHTQANVGREKKRE